MDQRTPPQPGRRRRSRPRSSSAIGDAYVNPAARASPPHPRLQAAARAPRRDGQRGRRRLGHRRAARVRLAAASRACRCGWPARTPAAARSPSGTRCSSTARPARSTRRWRNLTDDQAPFFVYDSLLSRVRGDGLRVRLLGGQPDALVLLGGAVRRLRRRRADDHRRVHLLRRGQVGPALRRRRCCCRTATRARARTTRPAGIERFLQLCAENNMTVAICSTPANYFHLLRRQALSPSAPAADRLHAEVAAAAQGGGQPARRVHRRHASSRCSPTPASAASR